ncbi:putative bifunctional diguanylate cyclase/phosphodiesterase [Massilia timonae]|uniref:Diguanylate cyclase (GGDEF) domain-containing protein n=1 Tax=Massilia timonae CCUG 45783 TaxID=883126 RepID=K9DG80_9BURK|nr:EAL domain-containing protein [Massilia timonae]EKU82286.1 diguanylate cyclase (GGDEF) domain-containing protein [Massilia timonae CCUG 45783]
MLAHDDVAQWRARVFTSLMSVVLVLALIAAVPSAALAVYRNVPAVALMDTAALAWILAIWRMDHLAYRTRVLNFLAMLYIVGVGSMLAAGAIGLFYLLAAPALAAVLLGTRPAISGLALSAATLMVLGLTGQTDIPVGHYAHDSLPSVLILTLNFTCVGGLITLSCGTLLKGLAGSLNDVRTSAASLEEGQSLLRAMNGELRLTSAALAGLNEMVLIVKVDERPGAIQPVIFANRAFERRSGYRADEIVGRSMRMLHGPDTDPAVVARIVEAMGKREPVSAELVNYSKTGEPCWVEIEMVPFAGEGGPITHLVVVGRDITERRRSADAIEQLAFFDVLTGLPNRRLLMERLHAMVEGAHAGRGLGAVLYIDLDNFKSVNDARGHATGDALLKHVAAHLVDAVREGDTVARLGGDEFVILAANLGSDGASATAAAQELAQKVGKALRRPAMIDNQVYHSSGSIGVALPLRLGQTMHDLLREADTAMYHAKAAGRNGVALFETTMLAAAENVLTLERDLADALARNELALHLQLQVDPAGAPVGAEVLLRWRRADGVLVPPDVFIPVAEETGLIVPLGAWVLRHACLAWRELERAGHALPLSINVSPRQFRQPDFVAMVRAVVQETGVPPRQLIFEVTEGLLVDDIDDTVSRMQELAHMGIRFSIDDFGTGYSNLAYLRKMPLYELKIDKGFIRDMPDDSNGTALVQSILAMAGQLGLRVVAEGIETSAQARFLAEHGQPCMQGYLFCRPMPLPDLIERLASAEVGAADSLA